MSDKASTLDRKYSSRGDANGATEYSDLYNLITNKKPASDSANEMYDELMKREERVLKIVDRVVDDKQAEHARSKTFSETPVNRIPYEMYKSVRGFITDLQTSADYGDVWKATFKGQRVIYIGLLLMIIAVFLMLIQVSENDAPSTKSE